MYRRFKYECLFFKKKMSAYRFKKNECLRKQSAVKSWTTCTAYALIPSQTNTLLAQLSTRSKFKNLIYTLYLVLPPSLTKSILSQKNNWKDGGLIWSIKHRLITKLIAQMETICKTSLLSLIRPWFDNGVP
jgi:hypothetical protein